MDHNAYFGLPNCHVADLLDEEALTYGEPLDVAALGGIIEIALDTDSSTEPLYASDQPWIDDETDNGFTGTIRFVNVWGEPTLRRKFAPYVGYQFAADGTLLGSTGRPRKKFALMSGQSGNIQGKRTCYLMCQVSKPAKNAATKEGNGVHQADEFPIVARPVKLPSGWKGSFYENVPEDGALYEDFFQRVRTDMVPETDGAATLSALAVGPMPLTPTFAAGTTSYALTTTESSLAVTAVPTDEDATVAITCGETTVANGGSAALSAGENVITVTVTNGTSSKTYTVTVTKE